MINKIIDTNVWLRYLVKDNPQQHQQAIDWLKLGQQGQYILIVKPVIVAETCFVLESFYKQNRQTISETWQNILSQKWLKVSERQELLGLWPFYLKGLHWVDSYQISWAICHKAEILTFDKQLASQIEV